MENSGDEKKLLKKFEWRLRAPEWSFSRKIVAALESA
jgi:hypothetical protein